MPAVYGCVKLSTLITPPPDMAAEYYDERARLFVSVCLSVRDHILGTARLIFTDCLCVLPMAVARSSSGGVVIRYVLPVLWMTSY